MQNNTYSHVMNINNNKLTKIAFGTAAIIGLCLMGLNHLHADLYPMLGVGVSYLAALAILGLAALDNGSAKRQY